MKQYKVKKRQDTAEDKEEFGDLPKNIARYYNATVVKTMHY